MTMAAVKKANTSTWPTTAWLGGADPCQQLRIQLQPVFQSAETAKEAVEGEQGDPQQGQKLDQRGDGDRHHQSAVAVAQGGPPGTEKDGEQGDDDAEDRRYLCWCELVVEQMQGVGNHLDLDGDQRQAGAQHGQGGQGADPATAKAKGKQVRQGGKLIGAGDAQNGDQQYGGQHESEHGTDVGPQIEVAGMGSQLEAVVKGPGTGEGTERQGMPTGDGVPAVPEECPSR